jgi:hypothetical protein
MIVRLILPPHLANIFEKPGVHHAMQEQNHVSRRAAAAAAVVLYFTLGIYLALLFGGLLAALAALWPVPPDGHATFSAFNWSLEVRYLLIVAIAGAIGSYIHLATSFTDHAGHRRLGGSWASWYLLRPFIGACLALLVYFTVRGGLTHSDATSSLSPYGLAAMAGMSGLFSRHATEKLREVFENLFRTEQPQPSPDAPPPAAASTPDS